MLDNECLKAFYNESQTSLSYDLFETLYLGYAERTRLNTAIRTLDYISDMDVLLRDFIKQKMYSMFDEFSLVNDINITSIFADKVFSICMFKPTHGTGKYRSVRITCSFGSSLVLFSYRDRKEEYTDCYYKLINSNIIEVEHA